MSFPHLRGREPAFCWTALGQWLAQSTAGVEVPPATHSVPECWFGLQGPFPGKALLSLLHCRRSSQGMSRTVGHKLPWAVQKVLHKIYPIIAPIFNLDSILVCVETKEISSFP